MGRKQARHHGFGFPMLGHYIVTSVIRQLMKDYKINMKHTKVEYPTLWFHYPVYVCTFAHRGHIMTLKFDCK